jgi:hypothetical protein
MCTRTAGSEPARAQIADSTESLQWCTATFALSAAVTLSLTDNRVLQQELSAATVTHMHEELRLLLQKPQRFTPNTVASLDGQPAAGPSEHVPAILIHTQHPGASTA